MPHFEGFFQASSRKLGLSVDDSVLRHLADRGVVSSDLTLPFLRGAGYLLVTASPGAAPSSWERHDYILTGTLEDRPWLYVASELVDPITGLALGDGHPGLEEIAKQPDWLDGLSGDLHLGLGLDLQEELLEGPGDIFESLTVAERYGALLIVNAGEMEAEASKMVELTKYASGFPLYLRELDPGSLLFDRLPPAHSIPAGFARLFQPNPRFDVGRDGIRHPLVDLAMFSQHSNLGRKELCHWLSRKLDFEYAGDSVLRFRSAVPHLRLLLQRSKASQSSSESEGSSEDIATLEKIRELYSEQEAALNNLSILLANTKYDLDFQALELEEATREVGRLQAEKSYLRGLLAEQKVFITGGVSHGSGIWEIQPTSFSEILEAIQLTDSLKFTGKYSHASELDDQPNIGAGLARAWNGLRALDSYVLMKRDGRFQGGFFDYLLDDTHPGFKVPGAYFSPKESESVKSNPALHDARLFRVPEEVRPGGTAYMEAHLRVMTSNGRAPRMHYLDDTSNTGYVWIGYLGPHLPL